MLHFTNSSETTKIVIKPEAVHVDEKQYNAHNKPQLPPNRDIPLNLFFSNEEILSN